MASRKKKSANSAAPEAPAKPDEDTPHFPAPAWWKKLVIERLGTDQRFLGSESKLAAFIGMNQSSLWSLLHTDLDSSTYVRPISFVLTIPCPKAAPSHELASLYERLESLPDRKLRAAIKMLESAIIFASSVVEADESE